MVFKRKGRASTNMSTIGGSSSQLVFVTGPPRPYKTRAPGEIPRPGPLTCPGRAHFYSFPTPTTGQGPTPAMPRTGPHKLLVMNNGGPFRE